MSQPTFFIRVHEGRVVDVCSETPDAPRFVVIDEDGHDSELEAEDGSTFLADVYDVRPTAPHFDAAKVVALSSGTMTAGSFEHGEALPRARRHDLPFEVRLRNVGNPDFRQDPERPVPGTDVGGWKPVASLRAAAESCRAYISENDLGGGNWAGGAVRRVSDGEIVAEISYNGRAWNPGSRVFGSGIDPVEIDLDETFDAGAAPRI